MAEKAEEVKKKITKEEIFNLDHGCIYVQYRRDGLDHRGKLFYLDGVGILLDGMVGNVSQDGTIRIEGEKVRLDRLPTPKMTHSKLIEAARQEAKVLFNAKLLFRCPGMNACVEAIADAIRAGYPGFSFLPPDRVDSSECARYLRNIGVKASVVEESRVWVDLS